jgi:hypothetical protein
MLHAVPWDLTMPEMVAGWRGPMRISSLNRGRSPSATIKKNETSGGRALTGSSATSGTPSKRWGSTNSTPLYELSHWSRWGMRAGVPLSIVAQGSAPKRPSICSCLTIISGATRVASATARPPWTSGPESPERRRGGSGDAHRATLSRASQTLALCPQGHRFPWCPTTRGGRINRRLLPAKQS